MNKSKLKNTMHNTFTVKPFVKWAGGKTQLLEEIRQLYPDNLGKKYTKYAEPFVGGGAVFFDILNKYELSKFFISDINKELIITYKSIKNSVDKLIKALSAIQTKYISLDIEARKDYYYSIRDKFNRLKTLNTIKDRIELSALFIFLNRTCFNGLYRVNQKGIFNVPVGAYKNPLICDENNLRNISDKMKNVEIVCGDYTVSESFIDEKTFVYFDPPYRPITKTSSFTAYSENIFDDIEQKKLSEFVKQASKKGAKIIVSNSDPKNSDPSDNFFDNLYSKHRISRIKAIRMINSNSSARGHINELLITNF